MYLAKIKGVRVHDPINLSLPDISTTPREKVLNKLIQSIRQGPLFPLQNVSADINLISFCLGRPIVGAGAGCGISAKFEEVGGGDPWFSILVDSLASWSVYDWFLTVGRGRAADLIVIYNSGRFRMGGRGSLAGLMPYKDANAIVLEMADEVPCLLLFPFDWVLSVKHN